MDDADEDDSCADPAEPLEHSGVRLLPVHPVLRAALFSMANPTFLPSTVFKTRQM